MARRTHQWLALLFVLPLVDGTADRSGAASIHMSRAAMRAPTRALSDSAVPNDNRNAAGQMVAGVYELRLEARHTAWRADPRVDSLTSVMAFAEPGGAASIPGPLQYVQQGTRVRLQLFNALDTAMVVHGLRAGSVSGDTVHVARGETRVVEWVAAAPGTYLYWGTTTGKPIRDRRGRDSQLTGALVVAPAGSVRDTADRIFVLTVIDMVPGDQQDVNTRNEDIWELGINGRSWPHTERLQVAVGDTARWRFLNGSYLPHPMHLHGFHFRLLSKGNGRADTTYPRALQKHVVTEFMPPGSTMRMAWTPTRVGQWLFHCHMLPHITPFPARADSAMAHDLHDVERHPVDAMAGLVLGVTSTDTRPAPTMAPAAVSKRLRVLVQKQPPAVRAPGDTTRRPLEVRYAYVRQRGRVPAADSVPLMSSTLVLTRGERTAITVVNRLPEPTTVHWHGMELESVYDGVSGWSRSGSRIAPLVAPGDSFTAVMTPPRAGTFLYHTHMDEGAQLPSGLYGALIVLEPGERHDLSTDMSFVIGSVAERTRHTIGLNGTSQPPPLSLRVGKRYRFRLANMHLAAAFPVRLVELADSSIVQTWHAVAKDGAALPPGLQRDVPATIRALGVGETYDFYFTPPRPGTYALRIGRPLIDPGVDDVVTQVFSVRR